MTDVAALGIAIDTGQSVPNLRNLETAAKRAGISVEEMQARIAKASSGAAAAGTAMAAATGAQTVALASSAQAAGAHARRLSEVATSTQKASAATTIFARSLQGAALVLIGVGVFKAIDDIVGSLATLGDRMQDTRLSGASLQGLKIAAAEARVSVNDLNKAIDTFTDVSKKAVPDAKEFYKALSNVAPAFAAAFQAQAGKAGGQDERLRILADALKNARNETERYQLAQKALGTDNDRVIDMFVQGRQAIDDYITKAREYGIIVDDAFIKKARDAERTLGILSTVISDQLRVAIVNLLPDLQRLFPYIETIATKIGDFLASYAALADQPTGTLLRTLADDLERIKRLEDDLSKANWIDGMLGNVADRQKRLAEIRKEVAEIQSILEKRRANGGNESPSPTSAPGFTPRPSLGGTPSPFDSSVNSINKHIAAMKADAEAVGKTAAEHARLRTENQLLEVVQRDGGQATAEQVKKIKALGLAAAEAADNLARARINDQIRFDRQTAFLSQEDVQIASQLRDIYPDVATALSSVEAAGMRANSAMRELASLGQDVNRGLFVEFNQNLRNGMSAWDAFREAGVNALNKISDKLMQMAADNLWNAAFGGSSGGGIGRLFSSLFGGGSAPGSSLSGLSSYGSESFGVAGITSGFASGTDAAPGGLAMVGEQGPELLRLPRGAAVMPNNQFERMMAANNNAPPSISIVNHNDFRGADPSMRAFIVAQQQVQNQAMKRQIEAEIGTRSRNAPGYIRRV